MKCDWKQYENGVRRASLLAALSVVVIFCIVNGRWFQFSDSAAHYYEGLIVALGGTPFIDFVENKNPGIYYLCALAASVGGWNMAPAILLFRLLDIVALFSIWKLINLFAPTRAISALIFLCATVAYSGLFLSGLETLYVESQEICLAALAYWIYLHKGMPFKTGAVIGFSLIFRQTALVDLVAIATHLIVMGKLEGQPVREIARRTLLLALGAAIPCLAMLTIAFNQGWLDMWWQYAYLWNLKYKAISTPAFLRPTYLMNQIFLATPVVPLSLALLAWFWSLARQDDTREPLPKALSGTILSSSRSVNIFLAAVLLLHFLESSGAAEIHLHHILTFVPALAMCGAWGLGRLLKEGERTANKCLMPIAGGLCLFAAMTSAVAFELKAIGIHLGKWEYLEREDRRIHFIGTWIREHSEPEDRVLAWGWKPEMYLAAQRHAGSSFVHFFILTNWREKFAPLDTNSLERFDAELRRNRPKFIFLFDKIDIGKYSSFAQTSYRAEELEMPAGEPVKYLRLIQ
jgi:hypothetical protein